MFIVAEGERSLAEISIVAGQLCLPGSHRQQHNKLITNQSSISGTGYISDMNSQGGKTTLQKTERCRNTKHFECQSKFHRGERLFGLALFTANLYLPFGSK